MMLRFPKPRKRRARATVACRWSVKVVQSAVALIHRQFFSQGRFVAGQREFWKNDEFHTVCDSPIDQPVGIGDVALNVTFDRACLRSTDFHSRS